MQAEHFPLSVLFDSVQKGDVLLQVEKTRAEPALPAILLLYCAPTIILVPSEESVTE